MAEKENKNPEKKFNAGVISAAVWKNKAKSKDGKKDIEFMTISLQRRYKDKEGNWQSTNTFRANDVHRAMTVLQKAFEFITLKDTEGKDEEDIDEVVV